MLWISDRVLKTAFSLLSSYIKMGKVKIPIQKIENPNSRQVCFSKRRMGIFKKASELAILCGAEIAIIVYSPAGKAFTFGSPDIDFVVDKYQNIPVNIDNEKVQRVRRSEQLYSSILGELDAEKKRTDKLKRQEKNKDMNMWWTKDTENLQLPELLEFCGSLKTFRERIIRVAQEKESINSFANAAPNEMEDAQMPQQSCYFQHGDTESTRQTSPSFASASGVQYHSASQDEARVLNTIDPWSGQDLYQHMMGSSLNDSTEAMDYTLMPFNTALQKSDISIQDNNAAFELPFLSSQNPSFPTNCIPSHLLVPDERCLPLSTEISELDRLVMPDKQYLLSDADVGHNDYHIQNSNIRDNEFPDLGHGIENTFTTDYGKTNE